MVCFFPAVRQAKPLPVARCGFFCPFDLWFIMSFSLWFTFFGASLLLAIAPGPDNLFVLTQSAVYGVRSGLLGVLGLS